MKWKILFISLLCVVLFLLDIALGAVRIPLDHILKAFYYPDLIPETSYLIIKEYRLTKAITALLAGSALALSGLLMQTLFRNPLAGPYVLGISNGASLGVAISILGSVSIVVPFFGDIGIMGAAFLGSLFILSIILIISTRGISNISLLIIGLMVGAATGSIVSVLQSLAKAEEIQAFVFWSFGSVSNVDWSGIFLLTTTILISIFLTYTIQNHISVFIAGEEYAKTVGVRIKRLKWMIILITCLLAGSVTAYCGPISFVGLAVPHMIRIWLRTEQFSTLFFFTVIGGACFILLCDIISHAYILPFAIPLNAISAFLGAPVVISMLMRRRNNL